MKKFKCQMVSIGHLLIPVDKFRAQIVSDPVTGCANWTGVQNNAEYGFFGVYNTIRNQYGMMTAHRVALMLHLDRMIAPGMNANHTCHNRLCCNPDHLYEGTQQQKIQSMRQDNRFRPRTGVDHPGAYNHKQLNRTYRWTEEEIIWGRTARLDDIAQRFNVPRNRAAGLKWVLKTGYRWLPGPGRP